MAASLAQCGQGTRARRRRRAAAARPSSRGGQVKQRLKKLRLHYVLKKDVGKEERLLSSTGPAAEWEGVGSSSGASGARRRQAQRERGCEEKMRCKFSKC